MQNAEQAVAIPIDNESLLKHSSAIRTIERSRTAFDQSLKDLPERKAELATKRTELDTALAELGPDWDAERLASFDLSIVAQEEVSTHADRRRTASEEVVRSQSALVAAETALQEAAQTAERTQGDAESAPQPELDGSGIRERRGQHPPGQRCPQRHRPAHRPYPRPARSARRRAALHGGQRQAGRRRPRNPRVSYS